MGACEHESMSAERIDSWTWLTRETDVTHQVACNIEFVFSRNAWGSRKTAPGAPRRPQKARKGAGRVAEVH